MKQFILAAALLFAAMTFSATASAQTDANTGATMQVDNTKKTSENGCKAAACNQQAQACRAGMKQNCDGKKSCDKASCRQQCDGSKDCARASAKCDRQKGCNKDKAVMCDKAKANCRKQPQGCKPTRTECAECPNAKKSK